MRREAGKSKWLKGLRNCHSFHYPSLEQWTELVTPDATKEDNHIYMAMESGNVYYAASDSIASHWMFQQMALLDPQSAVNPMVTELIALLGGFAEAVETTLGAFISDRLLVDGPQTEPCEGVVETPLFEHVSIPFWTNMPLRKTSSDS